MRDGRDKRVNAINVDEKRHNSPTLAEKKAHSMQHY